MSYPVLTSNNARSVGEGLQVQEGSIPPSYYENSYKGLDQYCSERQGGTWRKDEFLANAARFLREMSEDLRDLRDRSGDEAVFRSFKTSLEIDFAKHITEQIKLLDPDVLNDQDFWRYLTLFVYRRYVVAREGKFISSYYGGTGNRAMNRWTLLRGLLWGHRTIVDEDSSYVEKYRKERLAKGLKDVWVADYYIQNVVRRKLSSFAPAARAFIDATLSETPTALFDISNEIRPTNDFGSLIARASENIFLPALTQQEMQDYFEEIKQRNAPTLKLFEPDL